MHIQIQIRIIQIQISVARRCLPPIREGENSCASNTLQPVLYQPPPYFHTQIQIQISIQIQIHIQMQMQLKMQIHQIHSCAPACALPTTTYSPAHLLSHTNTNTDRHTNTDPHTNTNTITNTNSHTNMRQLALYGTCYDSVLDD